MNIVDPFETASGSAPVSKGIVDPFEAAAKTPAAAPPNPVMSGFLGHLSTPPTPPEQGDSFFSGLMNEPVKGLKGFASRAVAPLGVVSPFVDPLLSLGGYGLAKAEDIAGRVAVSGLQKLGLAHNLVEPDQKKVFEQAKQDVGTALSLGGPARTASFGVMNAPFMEKGVALEADIARAKQLEEASAASKAAARAAKQAGKAANAPPPSEAEAAQERLTAEGKNIDIPRALTSNIPGVRSGAVGLSKFPVIGEPLDKAARAVPAQIGSRIEDIAGQFSPPLPENIVGGGIERTLSEASAAEAAAGRSAAETAHEDALQQFQQEQAARVQAVHAQQAQADAAVNDVIGNFHPHEVAEDASRAVQDYHRRQSGADQQRWESINNLDAHTNKEAFHNLNDTVNQGLQDAGVSLSTGDTPNALNMMQEIERLSARPGELPPGINPRLLSALEQSYGRGQIPPDVLEGLGFPGGTAAQEPQFGILGRHAPDPASPTVPVQGMEVLRKRIGNMAFNAKTPTDIWASNQVKNIFGDWYGNALENHMSPGSAPGARQTIRDTVAGHRAFKEQFGYNYRSLGGENRTAAKLLNQIATGDVGRETIARNLVGDVPGSRGISEPLYNRIIGAVDDPARVRTGVRGAYWNQLSQTRGTDALLRRLENLQTSRMGERLFDQHEHGLMQDYTRFSAQTPHNVAAIEAEAAPKPIAAVPGKAEQLANRIVGKTATRSDEKILSKFDSAIRHGGDIKEATRIWGRLPEANRNEIKGNWLRGLGGEEFNLSKFITNWNEYSDQAKRFMLDRSHRQNLSDFHSIASEYQKTLAKYGNPSGTAQVSKWHQLLSGAVKTGAGVLAGTIGVLHPIGIAMAGLGLHRVAKIMARPQGARSMVQWSRLAQAYKSAPSKTKLIALSSMTRRLNEMGD